MEHRLCFLWIRFFGYCRGVVKTEDLKGLFVFFKPQNATRAVLVLPKCRPKVGRGGTRRRKDLVFVGKLVDLLRVGLLAGIHARKIANGDFGKLFSGSVAVNAANGYHARKEGELVVDLGKSPGEKDQDPKGQRNQSLKEFPGIYPNGN